MKNTFGSKPTNSTTGCANKSRTWVGLTLIVQTSARFCLGWWEMDRIAVQVETKTARSPTSPSNVIPMMWRNMIEIEDTKRERKGMKLWNQSHPDPGLPGDGPPCISLDFLSDFGTAKRRRLATPLRKVSADMKRRKFPILSATIPAIGGPTTSTTGMALFTQAVSSTENPRYLSRNIGTTFLFEGFFANISITAVMHDKAPY